MGSFFLFFRVLCAVMDIFQYYCMAEKVERRPALLEFTKPTQGGNLAICGIDPTCTLEVKAGRLYKDGKDCEDALELFRHLALEPSPSFFPAYVGFFSYEFASYFKKPCHLGKRLLPDAFFRRYERGLVIDDGAIVHHDPIQPTDDHASKNLASPQELRPALTRLQFFLALKRIKDMIRAGDVYQVNFSLPLFFDAREIKMPALYAAIKALNNSPFMGMIGNEDWQLLSGSPERLFSYKHGLVTARPIAGTKKRGADIFADNAQLL
ncbi:MAG TPA: chorismate-binding protein, partial [Myxococcota bacterium]|nr:chorismate-binding protein [Myxococcota bacterium]